MLRKTKKPDGVKRVVFFLWLCFSGIFYAPAICIDQIGANPVAGSGKAVNLRAKPLIVKHYGRTQETQFIYGKHGTHAP